MSAARKAPYTTERCPPYSSCSVRILMAVRIARRFAHHVPTVAELRDEYGMSSSTASRWIAALRQA